MAVTLPGTGVSIASDTVGTDQMQRVKLVDGWEGSATGIAGTPENELLTVQRTLLFGDPLMSAVDGSLWATTVANGGSVVAGNGSTLLSTNAAANGSAKLSGLSLGRTLAGTYTLWEVWLKLSLAVAGNLRQWGAYDANNGLFFQLFNTTLSVVTRRGGSDISVGVGSWVPGGFALDTNWHRYGLMAGGNDAFFLIDGEIQHRILGAGQAAALIGTLDLPLSMENGNQGGSTTAVSMDARSAAVSRMGPYRERNLTGRNTRSIVAASGFRTVGSNATPHSLFTLENGSSSAVVLALRELELLTDSSAANTKTFQVKVSKPAALPSGGTVLTKVLTDSFQTSDANVVARGAAASDGGAATAITVTAGATLWQRFLDRPHTLVGWYRMEPLSLLPDRGRDPQPFLLRPGESVCVQATTAAGADNVSTLSYQVNAEWEEILLP